MDVFFTGTLLTATQPNIDSLGILTDITVSGTSTFSNLYASSMDSSILKIKNNSISIGNQAGVSSQRTNTIAIGYQAGYTNQGTNSIAIGFLAGMTNQPRNSIVINASDTGINASTTDSTFIAPVRNVSQTNVLGYETTTNEITYFIPSLGSTTGQMAFFRFGTAQTVSNNTDYVIKFDTTVVNNITGLSHNTSIGVFTLGSPGMYNINYIIYWPTTTGDKIGWILWSAYSGVYFARSWKNSAGGSAPAQIIGATTSIVTTTANETIQVVCRQTSGSNQNITGALDQGTYVIFTRVA